MIKQALTLEVTMMDQDEVVSALGTLQETTGVDHFQNLMTAIMEATDAVGTLYLVTGFSGEVYWTDDLEDAAEALEDEDEAVTVHYRRAYVFGERTVA